jgi:hypothetical protein
MVLSVADPVDMSQHPHLDLGDDGPHLSCNGFEGCPRIGTGDKDIQLRQSNELCEVKCGEARPAAVGQEDTLYTITNPEKATGHEGHTVKVTGKTDESAKTVTIDTLEMAAK